MSVKAKGSNNSQWKGSKVQYAALHEWVRNNFGSPTVCEDCDTKNLSGKKIHWANISGLYKRIRSDWKRLCVKCHSRMSKGKTTTLPTNGCSRIRSLSL